jgi:glucan-binding YG repeat protein
MSKERENDSPKPTKKRKANARPEAPQERPAKRVKQAVPKVSKKQVTSGVNSDIEMEAKPKMKAPSQKKPKVSKQTIDDSEEEEEPSSTNSKKMKQREYSSAIDSDTGAAVPPKSPEVGILHQRQAITYAYLCYRQRKRNAYPLQTLRR